MIEPLTAPCFRCRHSKREMQNVRLEQTKNKKTMAYGTCEKCGTSLARLVKTGTVL